MVSRMLKVGNAFDLTFLRKIGSAPSIGRDRWLTLAKLVQEPEAKSRAEEATTVDTFSDLNSDERFESIFKAANNKPTPKAPAPAATEARTLRNQDGKAFGRSAADTAWGIPEHIRSNGRRVRQMARHPRRRADERYSRPLATVQGVRH